MKSLRTLSWRGLLRRPARTILSGAGVAIGVAVLYAVVVISGATSTALEDDIEGNAGETDVFVSPVGSYEAVLPPDLAAVIEDLPDVRAVLPVVTLRSLVVTADADPLGEFERNTIVFIVGTQLERAGDLREYALDEGAMPRPDADEIAIARHVADELGVSTGDVVEFATAGGLVPIAITGVLEDVGAARAFQGSVGHTSIGTAQRLLDRTDESGAPAITGIDIDLVPGVDVESWIDAHRTELGEGIAIRDADSVDGGFRNFLAAITGGLLLMSVIAVFVGGFLVFLTVSVGVAEQTRIYGTLRALGSVPRQIQRVVVGEAAFLGLLSGIVGVLLGRLIAGVSVGVTEALLGVRLRSLGFPVGAAVFGLAVGAGTASLAAWLPSRRAATIAPVVAMREGARSVEGRGRVWPRALILVAGIALGSASTAFGTRAIAALLVLVGAVFLTPFLLRPVAGTVGRVTRRVGRSTGSIAVSHLIKERSRSAYTLALVMVVVAMLLSVASANQAMATTLEDIVDRQTGGGVQVAAPGAFDPAVEQRLEDLPGTGLITAVGYGRTELRDGSDELGVEVTVIDPATYFEVASFAWVDGDDESVAAALAAGGAVVLPSATATGAAGRGETVQLRTSEGFATFEVAGTYAVLGEGFGVVAGLPDAARFGAGRPSAFLIDTDGTVDTETLARTLAVDLSRDYHPIIRSPEDFREQAYTQLQGFFGLTYTILVAAAVAGLLGLANTLTVSVLARTREIGILRSIGTLRKGIRQLVVVEAITLAMVAYVLAIPLAMLLAFGTAGAMRNSVGASIEFEFAWAALVPGLVITVGIAALAALAPGRRAGRLEPVAALRFD